MIQAVILDVDGVIVGEKIGYNSPHPHPDVIARLKTISAQNIPIILSTAKPNFSVAKIIADASLNNPHITDGGGVLLNPLTNEILKQHLIPPQIAQQVIRSMIENEIYTEFYTLSDYVAQKDQQSKTTEVHTHILQRDPILVDNLEEAAAHQKITKIMPIASNKNQQQIVTSLFESLSTRLTLSWGVHPVANPRQFGIITAPGISKRQGAIDILEKLNISFESALGVDDSTSDWQFIELCKHGAAMSNASQELKDLVQSKGDKYSYLGPGSGKTESSYAKIRLKRKRFCGHG